MNLKVTESPKVQHQEGLIAKTIRKVFESNVTWYDGKLELEVLPEIEKQLKSLGINMNQDTIKKRIDFMNLKENSKEFEQFVVVRFNDGSAYKIPVQFIMSYTASCVAVLGDLEISDVFKRIHKSPPTIYIKMANEIMWEEVRPKAVLITKGHPVGNYSLQWPTAIKELLTAKEIDVYQLQKNDQ